MRIDSVEVHLPAETSTSKFPSLKFVCSIVSPEVDESMIKQTYFRTLNPSWLRFIAKDIANANVLDIDSTDHGLDTDDVSGMARELDNLMAGKNYIYNCKIKGDRPDWSLESPASSF